MWTLFKQKFLLPLEDSLAELELLADTSGLDVVGELTQKLDRPHVKTYIGPGKVDELKMLVEETRTQVVIFDDELSPRHQRELQLALGKEVRVLDRTALILDIFAQHAHTSEGMLQVELAQYEYYLPRLTGQWTHLERQAGGGGGRAGSTGGVGLRGPGETQLEVDKRAIRKRIAHLKKELEKVRRPSSEISRTTQTFTHPHRCAGWIHQRWQVHAIEQDHKIGCVRGRPALRHARSHHA